MKKYFHIYFAGLVVLLVGLSAFTLIPITPDETEGKAIPSVKLKDLDGKDVDLKELTGKGKPVIISFWATWCSPCKKELDNINDIIDDWKKEYNVEVIAVSIDDSRNIAKVAPYARGKKWDFTILTDVNSDSKRMLNYDNVPYTIIVDKDGNIVYKHSSYKEGEESLLEEKLKSLK
ncbi:MAG: TlpA disulfide reductase family protein [Bacteroidota bacterium]|nr:TlpA disulfide reductase family protein [Bacteroidota bacterium]